MNSTKQLVKELQSKGINITYEEYWSVEPTGILIGFIMCAIGISPIFVFHTFNPISLVPIIAGISLIIIGIKTYLRNHKSIIKPEIKEEKQMVNISLKINFKSDKYKHLCFKCAAIEAVKNDADIIVDVDEYDINDNERCDKCKIFL